ncbi:zf-HC2 domain-containing protein [Lysobacter sp. CFH 32150]|uniref:zf-HC2 domain-containing protein n=1 Tax=Lysobacter sp. CFH 32150 TaxID=2927128 RepID=UPI001FA6B514|nr:zf-HC2 domain-containing protein [Lysobacter sp. CFH 32150]MCI4568946.1 zf-HC2 domain-containing protein [Lysobacter sp. CFH 32150]
MNTMDSGKHIAFDRLVDYWFGDAGEAETQAVDEHLMQCDACGAQADRIATLGHGVRKAFAAGEVSAVVSAGFVARLAERDMHVREYRVLPGDSVNCTVAPDDEVLVSRLQASLQGVHRLDLIAEPSDGATEHLPDVPFDPLSGEVVLAIRIAQLRELPAHEMQLRLLAVEDDGSREIGRYTFRHSPWQ